MGIDICDSVIKKIYHRETLICSENDLLERMNLFQKFSIDHEFIPQTSFQYCENFIYYTQQKITAKPYPKNWNESHFRNLIKTLYLFNDYGLVHGDVVKRNVIFDGNDLVLIDFEPSLKQIKNRCQQLLFTPPFIAIEDSIDKILTYRTDKIGFFFLVLRLRKVLTPLILKKMFDLRMKQGKSIIPVTELEFYKFSYEELLLKGFQTNSIDWI